MVSEGLSEEMTFEQRPKRVREQVRWKSGGRALRTEGIAVPMP